MRTNSKQVREAIRQHIQENVTDYSGDPFPTFEGARDHLKAEFTRVADYPRNRQLFPSNQDRFHDYMMGLPFSFEFETHPIQQFLDGLGINPQGKKYTPEKSARLYTYLIFKEL